MSNTLQQLKIKYASLRNLEVVDKSFGIKTYLMVVNIKDVPAKLEDWRRINPRDPKTTSGVYQSILKTLNEESQMFFFKNRGLAIVAESVTNDQASSTLTLNLVDDNLHGLLDGGHTHKAIISHLKQAVQEAEQAYVKVEVLTGLPSDKITDLVTARNTTTQVKNESLDNLKGKFEKIKKVLEPYPYSQLIAYQEYELGDEDKPKPIDIRDILAYLTCFNTIKYPSSDSLVFTYTSKGRVVSDYSLFHDEMKDDPDLQAKFNSLIQLLPEIIGLRDAIYLELPQIWNSTGSKYENTPMAREVYKSQLLSSYDQSFASLNINAGQKHYTVPDAFIYPLLAAFRSNLKLNDNQYQWRMDLDQLWELSKFDLVKNLKNISHSYQNNPQKVGKTSHVWSSLADTVKIKMFENMATS